MGWAASRCVRGTAASGGAAVNVTPLSAPDPAAQKWMRPRYGPPGARNKEQPHRGWAAPEERDARRSAATDARTGGPAPIRDHVGRQSGSAPLRDGQREWNPPTRAARRTHRCDAADVRQHRARDELRVSWVRRGRCVAASSRRCPRATPRRARPRAIARAPRRTARGTRGRGEWRRGSRRGLRRSAG